MTALLRTVMNQALFAYVEVSRSRATMPLIRQTANQILLKLVVVIERKEGLRPGIQEFVVDAPLRRIEGLQLAGVVMKDSDRPLEAEFAYPSRDGQRVLGAPYRTPQHRIDRDVELRVIGQQTKFLIQDLEAFLRAVVRGDVVDADLKIIESRPVQPLYAFGGEQIAVGDQRSDDVMTANSLDQSFQLGVKQRLAAAEGDGQRPELGEPVYATRHLFNWHRFGRLVVFVAIGAGEIASANGDDLRQYRAIRRLQRRRDHPRLAIAAVYRAGPSLQT